jgi:hypothetical protein
MVNEERIEQLERRVNYLERRETLRTGREAGLREECDATSTVLSALSEASRKRAERRRLSTEPSREDTMPRWRW